MTRATVAPRARRVLVTGADGFLGRGLIAALAAQGLDAVVAADVRDVPPERQVRGTTYLRLDARDTSGTFLLQRQGGGFEWWVDGTGTLRLNQNNTTALLVSPSGAVNVGTSWVHIATVGTGTGYRHFINGAQVATLTTAIVPADTSGALRVGGYDSSAAYDLAGRMALRITNGVARYTGAFTPPTDFPVS